MIGGFLATLGGSALARMALRHGVTALAILLFMLALRRSGERAGRLSEQLETTERSHDVRRRMFEAAARCPRSRDDLAERLLNGGFEANGWAACPPVVKYSREFQAQAT